MSYYHPFTKNEQTRLGHSRRTAGGAEAVLSVGLGALSLLAAPAAHAGTPPVPQSATVGPCTVTALQPYATGEITSSGKKLVRYPAKVDCKKGGLTVKMRS